MVAAEEEGKPPSVYKKKRGNPPAVEVDCGDRLALVEPDDEVSTGPLVLSDLPKERKQIRPEAAKKGRKR
jgi:hypothetical protein